VLPWLAACTIEPLAAIASAWPWAPRVTVRVEAVEQLPPVQVLALVVVTERFQGPAWAEVAIRDRATAITIRRMGNPPWGKGTGSNVAEGWRWATVLAEVDPATASWPGPGRKPLKDSLRNP
jgi:hypothetical protein